MAGPLKVNRELADLVRKLGLTEIVDVLENRIDYGLEFRKQLLLKLAPTLLPRINEHSGPGGGDLMAQVILLPERHGQDTMAGESGATDASPANIAE